MTAVFCIPPRVWLTMQLQEITCFFCSKKPSNYDTKSFAASRFWAPSNYDDIKHNTSFAFFCLKWSGNYDRKLAFFIVESFQSSLRLHWLFHCQFYSSVWGYTFRPNHLLHIQVDCCWNGGYCSGTSVKSARCIQVDCFFLEISFHSYKDCRIFCEGEYQVKNNDYAQQAIPGKGWLEVPVPRVHAGLHFGKLRQIFSTDLAFVDL